MNFRAFGLAAAIAVLTPAICNASAERAALNACTRAFASSLASPGTAVPAFKVVYGGDRSAGSVTDFFTREYTFTMFARKTGLLIARASCSADTHGSVIALSSIPLEDAAQPEFAAQN
jgi:hypothetical protein